MKILSMIPMFFVASIAFAAPRVNSGGGGWKCSDEQGTKWIRSLDLFESESFQIPMTAPQALSAKEILNLKLQKISKELPRLQELLNRYPVDLEKSILEVPMLLDSTEDAKLMFRPRPVTCPNGKIGYVQIANFLLNGTILISGPIWNDPQFPEQEKAAILLHEIIFKAVREEIGDENSWRARRLVGLVFSDLPLQKLVRKIDDALAAVREDYRDDAIAPFPVKTACYASIEDVQTHQNTSDKYWIAEKFGSSTLFELEGFLFAIYTSGSDGLPSILSIEEKASGVETSLVDIRQALIKTQSVSVKLRRKSPSEVLAKLYCRVEDK